MLLDCCIHEFKITKAIKFYSKLANEFSIFECLDIQHHEIWYVGKD